MTMKNKGITSVKKYFSTNVNRIGKIIIIKRNIFTKEYEFYAFYD